MIFEQFIIIPFFIKTITTYPDVFYYCYFTSCSFASSIVIWRILTSHICYYFTFFVLAYFSLPSSNTFHSLKSEFGNLNSLTVFTHNTFRPLVVIETVFKQRDGNLDNNNSRYLDVFINPL
jgi:hypothetical protein